jgi:hypothetical protein
MFETGTEKCRHELADRQIEPRKEAVEMAVTVKEAASLTAEAVVNWVAGRHSVAWNLE